MPQAPNPLSGLVPYHSLFDLIFMPVTTASPGLTLIQDSFNLIFLGSLIGNNSWRLPVFLLLTR